MACKIKVWIKDGIRDENPYLSDSDDHAEELLGPVEESPVLGGVSNFNQLGSGEQLHDEAGGDDGGDAELHEGSSVRSKDNSDPVEGVRRVWAHDAKEWNLRKGMSL